MVTRIRIDLLFIKAHMPILLAPNNFITHIQYLKALRFIHTEGQINLPHFEHRIKTKYHTFSFEERKHTIFLKKRNPSERQYLQVKESLDLFSSKKLSAEEHHKIYSSWIRLSIQTKYTGASAWLANTL